MDNIELSKKSAGEKAVEFISDGMIVGLGTGSTAEYAIKKLSQRIREENLDIIGIPTSIQTEKLAGKLGIKLSDLNEYPEIDVDIDGADEIDPEFNLIKGGGGAHVREKIVANASKEFIVIADHTKHVNGLRYPVPVEVLPFSWRLVEIRLECLGGIPRLRKKVKTEFKTDNGNMIIDTEFAGFDPLKLEDKLNSIPGVVDNGIFSLRRPDKVIIGTGSDVKILER